MPKKIFPGTDLDRKIRKHEDYDKKRTENFVQLCNFYKLDSKNFNQNDPSLWRELAIKMMNHLIRGFHKNNSGNKLRNTFSSDYEIDVSVDIEDLEYLEKTGKKKQSKKQRIEQEAKRRGLTQGQVKHAVERSRKFTRLNPELVYDTPKDAVLPDYLVAMPSDDRKERNRKKEKIIPK